MAPEAPDTTARWTCAGRIARSTIDADTVVVALRGDHDLTTVDAVTDAIARAVDSCRGDVVVDLSDVDFMDASTMGVLLRHRHVLDDHGRSLILRAPSAPAARVLHLCGIHLLESAAARRTSP